MSSGGDDYGLVRSERDGYAVYWAEACATWVFQGLMYKYEHAVEYVRLLTEHQHS